MKSNRLIYGKESIFSAIIIIFTILTGYSYYWNINNIYTENLNHALEQAKANWKKDTDYTQWASRHGGLYVKLGKQTPPNPGLAHVTYRDVVTTEGLELTLINPPYMMRKMSEEVMQTNGVKVKITGKKQLNLINKPDEWEQKVLDIFESGRTSEIYKQQVINDQPYLRYMKPMYMTEGCVKCHDNLGYKDGDLRGAVSISIPLTSYFSAAGGTNKSILTTHFIVWLIAVVIILILYILIKNQERSSVTELQKLHTSERKFRTLVDNIPGVSYRSQVDEHWMVDFISDEIEILSGYPPTDFIQNHVRSYASIIHPDDTQSVKDTVLKCIDNKACYTIEYRIICADGKLRWVYERGQGIFDKQGNLQYLDGVIVDVTERKQAENLIKKNSQRQLLLNTLLSISLSGQTLAEILQSVIEQLCKSCIISIEKKGAIFLVTGQGDCMDLAAHYNLPPILLNKCHHLSFGKCLCGISAASKTILYTNSMDYRHEITYEGMELHGHYCVPVLSGDKVLGVIMLYIENEHKQIKGEIAFLNTTANTVAGIIERKQIEDKLKHMASHDPLTGLYNRQVMEQGLNDEIQRSTRYKHSMSIFVLDIDHFKVVNDTYGHQIGDKVLCNLAKILESSIRNMDYAARYGGEEFVVILPETHLSKARELAERLREQIAEFPFSIADDKNINLTISIGVATFPEHAKTLQKLLEAADSAMYVAKKAGRNQVIIAS